ncbi:MAG TPA: transcriptional regulator [Bacillota bacterium]
MRLSEITRILDAEVLCGTDKLDSDVSAAFACDLMSDVLAFSGPRPLLLTGLTNSQVVRTAEVIDAPAIIFVRGKRPTAAIIALATEKGLACLLTTRLMYESCGLLYQAGLPGCRPGKEVTGGGQGVGAV